MRAVVFAIAILAAVPVLSASGQQEAAESLKIGDGSTVLKEIAQKEVLWVSAISANDPKTVSSLLDGGFVYTGRAQSDFDAILLPLRERLSRSQYLDTVTDSHVIVWLASKEIKVSVDDSGKAITRFRLQVHVTVRWNPGLSPGSYRESPKIQPGTYEITDRWTNSRQGWKAERRSAVRLLGGSLAPAG